MKKLLSVAVLFALATPALAAGDKSSMPHAPRPLTAVESGPAKEILAMSLTPLPIITTGVAHGDSLQGSVMQWRLLGEENDPLSQQANNAVRQMVDHNCSIRMPVYKDPTGRLQPKDGLAVVTCVTPKGPVVVSDVTGHIVGSDKKQGVRDPQGEKGFFVTHSDLHIPLE